MFVKSNPNPRNIEVGDCTIRAISLAFDKDWTEVYMDLCLQGLLMGDMPSSNAVWGRYLLEKGWEYNRIPTTCPYCYTIKDFCEDHKTGTYIVGTGTHVVCVKNGNYLDAWDSGDKTPSFYYVLMKGEARRDV